MAAVNLKSLVAKMNGTCRRSLEEAAAICLSRTNYNVEIEHWLVKMLEHNNTDLEAILRNYEIDISRLQRDLTQALDRLKTGNARPPALSPNIVDLAREAWLVGSVEFDAYETRTGHVLCALLGDDSLRRLAVDVAPDLDRISVDALRKDLPTLTANTDEATGPAAAAGEGKPGLRVRPSQTKTPSLDQFTIDLTERAGAGEIDPVLGRDPEIRQIIDILTRRRQNNPILTGEAGVGKTAVVEGFAQRVADGDVPDAIRNVAIHVLDLGLLQAGAGVRGEFENRLKGVIDEVKGSPTPIILFIDEAHTMIGAGGQAGQGDAANLLKPALARGELRTIAATTWAEYKKYFEKDAALARRFQVVKIDEPTELTAIDMMRGLVETLENHHKVRILSDGVVSAVKLSHRYITGRQLPDKSVSLLDTACARIALSQSATPPPVEDARRRIEKHTTTLGILHRESATGMDHAEEIEAVKQQLAAAEQDLERLTERWEKERDLVGKISEMQDALREKAAENPTEPTEDAQSEEFREQIQSSQADLLELQDEEPLVHLCVDHQAVAETVSSWTGIPLGRMVADEVKAVRDLKQLMEESIIGQSHALDAIAQQIRTARAQLSDPKQPIGVFLLAGPSGVGKTESAITLANLLYGGEQNMVTINMSEFKEEHKVSLLMGSPPGYVGYGEGGVLTEGVRRKPYSVVLLDEMEKAHPGVQDIFYQVFDKGTLKDGEGRDINFKNTVILMTTNAATDVIMDLCADPDTIPDPEGFAKAVFPELLNTFKPAFLGRLNVVPFYPLNDDVMKKIVRLKLNKIRDRVREQHHAKFEYTDELVDAVAERCTEVDTGARNVDHILGKTLLPQLAGEVLSRMVDGDPIDHVLVTTNDVGEFAYEIN